MDENQLMAFREKDTTKNDEIETRATFVGAIVDNRAKTKI